MIPLVVLQHQLPTRHQSSQAIYSDNDFQEPEKDDKKINNLQFTTYLSITEKAKAVAAYMNL